MAKKQTKITFFSVSANPDEEAKQKQNHENDFIEIETDTSASASASASTTKAKKRKFLPDWTDKFIWLRYNNSEKKMFCSFCESTNNSNPFTSGCGNLQKSALLRHQISKDHSESVKDLQLQTDLKKSLKKVDSLESAKYDSSAQTANHIYQLRTVYVMAKNNLPADACSCLMQLQQLNGAPVESYYTKPEIISEMECAITSVIENELLGDIKASTFIGIMLDETCDISIEKKLVVYIRYIKNAKVQVAYVGNEKITDCTAEGIKTSVVAFLRTRGLMTDDDLSKVMGLGTDGASVMVGCKNGLGVKLQQYNPMLIQVHCVAHRLNLAASQASRGVQYLEDYKSYIQTIYRFYSDSSVRYDKLRELQQLLHGKVKQVPEGTSVRWLSVESAVKMIYAYYDSIVLSLESDVDKTGKAAGIYRFVASAMFLLTTALLIDILTVIGILSLTFQKDHVNLSSIKHNVTVTVDTLEAMKNGSQTVDQTLEALGHVPEVGEKNRYKDQVEILDNQPIRHRFSTVRENYINNLKENITNRFPVDQLTILEAFDTVFNPKRYPDQGRNLIMYGNDEFELLLQHYGQILDQNRVKNQFLNFKYLALSYKDILDFDGFIELLLNDYDGVYPDLAKLASIAIVIPVSSAPCERGFSHQNAIKTKARNRLTPERLNRLMLIKIQGPNVKDLDFLSVAMSFNEMKTRRK